MCMCEMLGADGYTLYRVPSACTRCDLSWVLYHINALENLFGFRDRAREVSSSAITRLESLRQSNSDPDPDGVYRLTAPLGVRMTQLALDPRLSAALLAADRGGCTEELLTVAAMLSVQSIWVGGRENRRATDAAKLLCVPNPSSDGPKTKMSRSGVGNLISQHQSRPAKMLLTLANIL